MSDKLTICYFGIYDPNYARNWVIINGLRKNGVKVIECQEKPKRSSLFKLAWKYLFLKEKFDAVIVGFPGQEVMFLAKLIVRKPIIFDAFTSHYGGYILDRDRWSKNSFKAKYFRFLDRWSCKMANIVLLDTQAHINFFVREFGLSKEKFRRIWIGANDVIFKPAESPKISDGKFNVLFFGTYVPLQGAEYIVRSAKFLENQGDIIFHLIGKGQDRQKCLDIADKLGLKNIVFRDMLRLEDLRSEIVKADIVLGLFGNTPKTPLVIPNKIYEALAVGKSVITADTPAIRELFDANDLLLVEAANPEKIAEAILKLKNDPSLAMRLAESGHSKFLKFATSEILGREVKNIILSIINA